MSTFAKRAITRGAQELVRQGIGMNGRVAAPYLPIDGESDWYALTMPFGSPLDGHGQGSPIPPSDLWVGYGETEQEYLRSGSVHLDQMIRIMVKYDHPIAIDSQILDFGCAAGRMTRHVVDRFPDATVWGVDADSKSVSWAAHNIGDKAKFLTTTFHPHLPFESRSFDFIFSGSVFSHIDDLALAWFLELRRVLKKGASQFLTIQDETTIQIVLDKAFEDNWLAQFAFPPHIERVARDLLAGRISSFAYNRASYPHVYYNSAELVRSLSHYFSEVHIEKQAYGYQTGLILTK
jgi:ubiquinone/menaquinone biosynthesis C-methylase UbiE